MHSGVNAGESQIMEVDKVDIFDIGVLLSSQSVGCTVVMDV